MLISDPMASAMSKEVGLEYQAALQYDMIAAHFAREALPKLESLYRAQADEELDHAQRFIDYITEAGGVLEIPEVPAGKPTFDSVEDAVQTALDHELVVTQAINELMDRAIAENDHLARGMLQWFVDEQLEEISLQDDLLKVVRRAGADLNYVEQYVAAIPSPGGPAET